MPIIATACRVVPNASSVIRLIHDMSRPRVAGWKVLTDYVKSDISLTCQNGTGAS